MVAKAASVLLILSAAFSLSAAKTQPVDLKLDLELLYPPTVSYSASAGIAAPKNVRPAKWLKIQCLYSAGKGDVARYFDGLEAEVRILIAQGISVNGKPRYALCSGKAAFWTVRPGSVKREMLMFLPGALIERCCSPDSVTLPSGDRSVRDFHAEIVFRCRGAVLGRAYCNVSGSNAANQEKKFQEMAAQVPKELIFEGSVLSRAKSPWAGFYPDRYDAEKELPATADGIKQPPLDRE